MGAVGCRRYRPSAPIVVLTAIFVFSPCPGTAQTRTPLAVQIGLPGGGRSVLSVPSSGAERILNIPHSGLQRPSDRTGKISPQVFGLEVHARREGDSVRVEAIVVLKVLDKPDDSGSFTELPRQTAGTAQVAEDETAVLSDVMFYGLEPITVKAIADRPLGPRTTTVTNLTTTLKVESVEELYNTCRITVRNVGEQGITGFMMQVLDANNHQVSGQGAYGNPLRPIIRPWGIQRVQLNLGPQPSIPGAATISERIVIQAVTQADGAYQGEAEVAAKILGFQTGALVQGRRIAALLQSLLDKPLTEEQAMAELESQLKALPSQDDEGTTAAALAKYPDLSTEARAVFQKSLTDGLRAQKGGLQVRTREYERAKAQNPSLPFATYWQERQKKFAEGSR